MFLGQPSNELKFNRQNDLFLTVNRQRDPPPPIETLLYNVSGATSFVAEKMKKEVFKAVGQVLGLQTSNVVI